MNIKYTCFRSMLKYSSQFEIENNLFIESIEKQLGSTLINSDMCDYDCDLKLLFVQSGGSEGIFLANLNKLQSPFYLLTNGGNNSLAASLEILTYAKLNGYEGEIIHGDSVYIAKRIKELATINSTRKKLAGMNLGLIGQPSDWLISSVPAAEDLKIKLGINLKYLPLSDIESGIDTQNTLGNEQKEHEKAQKVYENIKKAVHDNHLEGLTIRCFDLLGSIKMTGCLALAKLNSEGVVATCEGDVAAMVSMLIVKKFFGKSSFQANPSRIDVENNSIILAHCTAPLDMAESFEYDTHFESGIGIAIRAKLKEQPVTLFRLSSSLKDYTVMQGYITNNLSESNLCRTQVNVKCYEDVGTLLKNPCGNHQIIFYGHHKDELLSILKNLIC